MQRGFLIGMLVFVACMVWRASSRFEYRLQEQRAQHNNAISGIQKTSHSEAQKKVSYAAFESGVKEAISKNPFFLALKKYDSSCYLRLQNSIQNVGNEVIRGSISSEQGMTRIIETALNMDEFSNKYLPHASDEAALAYAQVQLSVLRQFFASDVDLCFASLWGDAKKLAEKSGDMKSSVTQGTVDALMATKGLVIETAATNPQSAPDQTFVDKKLAEIGNELAKLHGDDVQFMADENAARRNKKKACALMIEVISRATRLPKKDASAVLRVMLAGK